MADPVRERVPKILEALDAGVLVGKALSVGPRPGALNISGRSWLRSPTRVWVAGAGKQADIMVDAALARLGELGVEAERGPVAAHGGHPIPDRRSLQNGRDLLAWAEQRTRDEAVLWCIGGGASALAVLPVAGVGLPELGELWRVMDIAGWPIQKRNLLRRSLSQIKGGRLATACKARQATLLMSDVIDGLLDDIGSGLTVPSALERSEAMTALHRLDLSQDLQTRLVDAIKRAPRPGLAGGTPFDHTVVARLADPAWARHRASSMLEDEGFECRERLEPLVGPIEDCANALGSELLQMVETARFFNRSLAYCACGEASVSLSSDAPPGGRNTHLALLLSRVLDGCDGLDVLCLATDGCDGASGGGGAVVDGSAWQRLRESGRDPDRDVREQRAAEALASIGALIPESPSRNNLADLVIATIIP